MSILDCIFKKKSTTRTILSRLNFELTYCNCDLHIVMRRKGAGRDIDNERPPIPLLQQQIVAY